MKRIFLIFITVLNFTAVSCSKAETAEYSINNDMTLNEQTLEQLRVISTTETVNEPSADIAGNSDNQPINYEHPIGIWYTYMNYTNILKGKSENEFTNSVIENFKKISELGINTLYVQVRGFCDSYYKSEIYPRADCYDGDYDPLEIMVNEGHKLDLSVHAWINPLRCQTEEQIKQLNSDYMIKKWYSDSEKNGTYIVRSADNFYFNPAYPEVISCITEGVSEIIENYAVDGIHIDDYFYPAVDESFDAEAFSRSGSNNLSQWRRDNINNMVKSIYDTVKAKNKNLVFGISPQGNISANLNVLYADVEKWASEPGYCDYIIPQLYYGFKNESCPFKETVNQWKSINTCDEVRLIAGLCTYKIGNTDKWAGSGKDEWSENRNIVSEQIAFCIENSIDFALYSFESTFSDDIEKERSDISKIIKENGGGDS